MSAEGPITGETFGGRIRARRRELRLTQRQVASELGIDFTYLSKLENDRGEAPGEKTVLKLAEVLQDDAEELLALAGKVPERLRSRAQEDLAFARLVRRLPDVTDDELKDISHRLNIRRPQQ